MVTEAALAESLHLIVALAAFVVAFAIIYKLDRPNGAWGRHLRSRFLLGVPWGTLVSVVLVACVYLFVQSGLENPYRPVVIPFRAWSYFSTEGLLWSGFAHSSLSHLTGNLLSALVAGTLAEYAYGHYPTERGASTFASSTSNPYVRALLVVPGTMVLFGVLFSLFAIGPVIGFSGVVFALWGFALIHYPIGTIAGLTGVTLLSVVYSTLRNPIEIAAATSSYGPPSWANVAVQGHALGLIAGMFGALWLIRRRRRGVGGKHASAVVVFVAVLLFGASRRLWAIYWYVGEEEFELYRAMGLALVALLALIAAVAVAGRDGPLRSALPTVDVSRAGISRPHLSGPDPKTIRGAIRTATPDAVGLTLLLLALAAVAGLGVMPNLATVSDDELPGEPAEIQGYQVTYAENVENQMVNVVDVEVFGLSTSVRTSGVIIKNTDRNIWTTAVSAGDLRHWGYRAIDVGGTGWRETIWAQRVGWVPVNGDPTYRVDIYHEGQRSTAFVSDSAAVEPRIDGRNVTVVAAENRFQLRVEYEGTNETAPMPAENESVTLQGIRFVREDRAVFAEWEDSRVRIADEERYEGRELQR